MIKYTDFYPRYKARVSAAIDKIKEDIDIHEEYIKSLECALDKKREFITINCNYEYDDLLSDVGKSAKNHDLFDSSNIDSKYVWIIMQRYQHSIKQIASAKVKLEGIKKYDISRKTFYRILEYINTEIFNEMIYNSYVAEPIRGLGKLSIKLRKNKGKSVDWGKSKKYKAELIAKGIPLYDKKTKKGTKWLICYEGDYLPTFTWSKKECSLRNHQVYAFKTTKSHTKRDSAVSRLYQYWYSHSEAIYKYPKM